MPNSPETLLQFLLENIVDEPKSVSVVSETDDYGGTVLKTTVAKDDMGKVIGKGGKTIRAIRNLVKALAIKQQVRVSVALTEEY